MDNEGSTSTGKKRVSFPSSALDCFFRRRPQDVGQTDRRMSDDELGQAVTADNNKPAYLSDHTSTRREWSNTSPNAGNPKISSRGDSSTLVPSTEGRSDQQQLLSETVPLDLIVSYNDERLGTDQRISVKWNSSSSFADLDTAAEVRLSSQGKRSKKERYRKSGRCRLVVDDTREQYLSRKLEYKGEWLGTVASMVTLYWSQNPDKKFHLEVLWNYSELGIKREDNETYATTIRNALFNKTFQNWKEQSFISKKDLSAIMSEATVMELINEDKSLRAYEPGGDKHDPSFNRSEFIKNVHLWCCTLLALFVYVKLDLCWLYKIMSKGFEDKDLPLTDRHCPYNRLGSDWNEVKNKQGWFLVHTFDEDGVPEYRELDEHTVVPIRKHKDLGKGSYGEVIEVSIEPAHHGFLNDKTRLLDDKTERFALKSFFDHGSRTQADFQNEANMLGLLATMPHGHITRHLALWTQQGKFHMLFPLAEQNLKDFLRNTGHPSLGKDNILWLLNQFKGLADAVRQIHNLTGLGPGTLDRRLNTVQKRDKTGFHHDLKPENILVFAENRPESHEQLMGRTWKIADFGSARIGHIISGSGPGRPSKSHFTSNLTHGDITYSAPDYALEQKTSRPYDMWSLGCIFMECLLWVFGMSDSTNFGIERTMVPDLPGDQDDAFWYVGNDRTIQLKPAVVSQLKELKDECAERGVFKNLVNIIARLLTITPAERPDAPKLCNELDALLLQAIIDLRNPEFYSKKQLSQDRDIVAAPPTTPGDHDRLSIDERKITPRAQYLVAKDSLHVGSGSISNPRGQQYIGLDPFQSSSNTVRGNMPSLINGFNFPDTETLPQLQTRDMYPASERSRTPSISLTPAEGNTNLVPGGDTIQNASWQSRYWRLDDHERLPRSNSQDSRRSRRSASWPQKTLDG
jgi:serine/threonine protein kinase